MDLSVIIVNYNVKEFLQNLIHSIKKASANLQTEIIVVDNASDDGSVELIREKFPEVNLISNPTNLGFSRANNIGLKTASGKYFLLINPDTLVAEDTFEKMIKFFEENADAGLAGCKILNPDGSLQLACRRSFPGPWTSFTKVTGLSNLFPSSKLFARYNLTYLDENQTYEVDAISGSFMMMKREVYEKIGGFDEEFFMYGEDLDLCYRIQKAGFKVFYVHTTQIIHYKGESTKRSNLDETKIFYNAMHLFVKKHLSSSFLVEAILQSAIGFRKLFAFIGKRKLIFNSVILDFVLFNVCLFISQSIYQDFNPNWGGFPSNAIPIVYTVPAILQIIAASAIGAYERNRLSVLKIIISLLISLPILTSLTFFFKQFAFSRAVVLICYLFVLVIFILWRIIAKLGFKIGLGVIGGKQKRTLVVGINSNSLAVANKLRIKKTDFRNIIGLISSSNKDVGVKIDSYEVVGTDQNLSKVIKEKNINEIIFSSGDLSYNKMMQIVSESRNENVDFKVVGNDLDFIVGKTAVSILDDIPLFDLNYNLVNPQIRFIKRLFDIVLSLLALFLVYPFIYFKKKVTKNHSEFIKFVLQFPSVVLGKASFVGPEKTYQDNQPFLGKRGLTGYWFLEDGTEEDKEKLDFYYAKNQNIWMDIEIITKSINKMWNKNK